MDKIIEKTRVLKENLDNLNLFKEYKNVKELIENNDELTTLKRDIVRAKNEGRDKEHRLLLEKYNNHPLILNYQTLKEEVAHYLQEVSEILNKWFM